MPDTSLCPNCTRQERRVIPGTGPHYGQLQCVCGRWLKWLSQSQVEALGGFTHQQTSLFDLEVPTHG